MKLVIDANGIKRELSAPFRLCASGHDLRLLRDQLDYLLDKANKEHDGWTYGWIGIIWPAPTDAGPNTKPRKWEEE